jgi:cell division protein FtsB
MRLAPLRRLRLRKLPILEPPPVREWESDARRHGGRRGRTQGVAPDPEQQRRERLRLHVSVFLLASLFAVGGLAALFGDRGYLDLRRARRELRRLEEQHRLDRQRLEALAEEVRTLRREPAALERIAREQLNLVKPGEILFLLPREQGREPFASPPRGTAGGQGDDDAGGRAPAD